MQKIKKNLILIIDEHKKMIIAIKKGLTNK